MELIFLKLLCCLGAQIFRGFAGRAPKHWWRSKRRSESALVHEKRFCVFVYLRFPTRFFRARVQAFSISDEGMSRQYKLEIIAQASRTEKTVKKWRKIDLQSLMEFLCFHTTKTGHLDHNMGLSIKNKSRKR